MEGTHGEGSYHHDPHRQPVPQPAEADVAVDARHGFAGAFTRYEG